MTKDCPLYSRWVSSDRRVWEKREWGWKFLGIAKSQYIIDVLELLSTDWDCPEDIVGETIDER